LDWKGKVHSGIYKGEEIMNEERGSKGIWGRGILVASRETARNSGVKWGHADRELEGERIGPKSPMLNHHWKGGLSIRPQRATLRSRRGRGREGRGRGSTMTN